MWTPEHLEISSYIYRKHFTIIIHLKESNLTESWLKVQVTGQSAAHMAEMEPLPKQCPQPA